MPAPQKLHRTLNLKKVDLDQILKLSDIITLHCPLNADTRNLIDKKAVKNIKKKGVKILSYYIQSSTTEQKEKELNENFQIMYGKEASFIDPKNVNEVTKTLNNLFLERNLIS